MHDSPSPKKNLIRPPCLSGKRKLRQRIKIVRIKCFSRHEHNDIFLPVVQIKVKRVPICESDMQLFPVT